MGFQIAFQYAPWSRLFPEFGAITEAQVTGVVLPLAEQYCRNDGGGPVTTAATQTNLLNLMVAHICQLLYGSTTQPTSPLVGRINSATEGSVSVGTDFPTTPEAAWYNQTRYGSMFWVATAPMRTMRYIPGPRRWFNPWLNQ